MRPVVISGIRPRFQGLSRSAGQITHVLLTRSPLITHPKAGSSFDLHVLSTPPAFVLSQDQTLRECLQKTWRQAREEPNQQKQQPPHAQNMRHSRCHPRRLTASSLHLPFISKKPHPDRNNIPTGDGISTYLALTFSTLLSSQRTDTSIVLTTETKPLQLSSGRSPSVFPTLTEVPSRIFPPDWLLRALRRAVRFPSRWSCKRTGVGRPDANRDAPLVVDGPSAPPGPPQVLRRASTCPQTSTTTGRIIGRRR
jgi:hypothetical protein